MVDANWRSFNAATPQTKNCAKVKVAVLIRPGTEPESTSCYAFVIPTPVPGTSTDTNLAFCAIFLGVWKCASVTNFKMLGL